MLRLLMATNNPGKVREFRSLLSRDDLELVTPAEIGLKLEVQESGSSYAENAVLKALAFSKGSGLLTLADDSGLEVDALGGCPGCTRRVFWISRVQAMLSAASCCSSACKVSCGLECTISLCDRPGQSPGRGPIQRRYM